MRKGIKYVASIAIFAIAVGSISPIPASANNKISKVRKIITFKNNASPEDIQSLISKVRGEKIKDLDIIRSMVIELPELNNEELSENSIIADVEDDKEVKIFGKTTPIVQPPQPSEVLPWGIDRIDAEKTFASVDTTNIKVCIIDTGIDITHPDLKDNIKGGYNTISAKNGYNDDNGHGTHVAGIIAASKNTIGVVGVAPKTSIYAVKALNSTGSGYISDIIEGISWAVKNNMNIINMSFGMNSDSQALHDAIIQAFNYGIVVVAAAGNDSSSTVSYPAAYPEVISVAAIDTNNTIASFSPFGKIDFVAPGVDIYSTYKGGIYRTLSGSSMAAPHVTGTVALLMSVPSKVDSDNNGKCSFDEIRKKLEATAIDLGQAGKDNIYGAGLINSYNSITN